MIISYVNEEKNTAEQTSDFLFLITFLFKMFLQILTAEYIIKILERIFVLMKDGSSLTLVSVFCSTKR